MTVDMTIIVDRLSTLLHHSREFLVARAAVESAFDPVALEDVADWESVVLPSRLASVTDSGKGARYAAWVIGETLWAIGGRDLMDRVFAAFEAEHGARGASWLDHRWDGVGGSVWCA